MLVMNFSCSSVHTDILRLVAFSLLNRPINMLIIRLNDRAFAPSASALFGAKQDVEQVALTSLMFEAAKATLRPWKQAEGHMWQTERHGRKAPACRNPHLVDYLYWARFGVPAGRLGFFIKVRLSERHGVARTSVPRRTSFAHPSQFSLCRTRLLGLNHHSM